MNNPEEPISFMGLEEDTIETILTIGVVVSAILLVWTAPIRTITVTGFGVGLNEFHKRKAAKAKKKDR
ncbi:MAG: hypothetical protein H8D97_01135 [Proteobacteria bacterium]|nr:hypothetical protein [Pseudomonadota bacterium]